MQWVKKGSAKALGPQSTKTKETHPRQDGRYLEGGRTSGHFYPQGKILSFYSWTVDSGTPLGPLFRGAASLEFCLRPKGSAPKTVWQHVAQNPAAPWLR